MKTISTRIRVLFTTVAFGALATFASAGPGIQYWKTLGSESDFKELKPEGNLVYVCNMCKAISDVPVKSQEEAMALCKEGASMTCSSCKKTSKVVRKTARNQPANHREVIWVDAEGNECGFMAVYKEKK